MGTANVLLDTSQYVRVNVGINAILLQAHRDSVRVVMSDTQPVRDNSAYHLLGGDNAPLQMQFTDTNVWALAMSDTSSLTVTETNSATSSHDFILEVSKGNVPGHAIGTIVGLNPSVGTTDTETVWDEGGSYTYLSADTQLYISSSDALDTAVTVVVTGLDDTFTEVVRTVTANGQTQVALSDLMFRVFSATVISGTSPVGDLYIAETDTLTAGVPDTANKIKAKIPLSGVDTGTDFASDNITHNGLYTVPAGKTFYALSVQAFVEKNIDVTFSGRFRLEGGSWINRSPSPLYQASVVQEFNQRLALPEKADLEFRAIAGNPGSKLQFQFQFLLVDN